MRLSIEIWAVKEKTVRRTNDETFSQTGSSNQPTCHQLEGSAGIIQYDWLFKQYAKCSKADGNAAGFALRSGMSYNDIIETLRGRAPRHHQCRSPKFYRCRRGPDLCGCRLVDDIGRLNRQRHRRLSSSFSSWNRSHNQQPLVIAQRVLNLQRLRTVEGVCTTLPCTAGSLRPPPGVPSPPGLQPTTRSSWPTSFRKDGLKGEVARVSAWHQTVTGPTTQWAGINRSTPAAISCGIAR